MGFRAVKNTNRKVYKGIIPYYNTMETNKIIKKAWEENYEEQFDVSESVKNKLIELWTMRACRFFVEGNLDTPTIEEDLEKGNLDYGLNFEKKEIKKS